MQRLARAAITVLAGFLACAPATAADDFSFEGETLRVVVPYPPGGGTTLTGQFFARWLGRHVDGGPTAQVVNIEGAGGVIGSNEYALSYPHDGLSVLLGSTALFLVREEGVRFDPRDFEPLASVPAGNVAYVRADTGVRTPADLANPAKPLHFAASRPSGGDLIRAFALTLLEAPITINYGYDGRGPARIAFEQGEASIDVQTTPTYLKNVVPLVDEGTAVPLFSFGIVEDGRIVRDPAFPDLPHVGEVYQALHGKAPEGAAWDTYTFMIAAGVNGAKVIWAHGDAPAGALDKLRAGVRSMSTDPDFIAEGKDELGGYDLNFGDSLRATVAVALNPSDEVVRTIGEFIASQNQ